MCKNCKNINFLVKKKLREGDYNIPSPTTPCIYLMFLLYYFILDWGWDVRSTC